MGSLQPLGDQAVLASFAEEADALRWAAGVRRMAPPWLVDVVPAYAAVAVFFDPDRTTFAAAAAALGGLALAETPEAGGDEGRLHHVPCCYELQLDLERVARHAGLAA